jgi:hypothetical protein
LIECRVLWDLQACITRRAADTSKNGCWMFAGQ